MAEDKILKPKTFRMDEETAEKIRQISETIGGNQQEAFSKLIEAYEFQSSKQVLTDQRSNIEQFEKYVNALTRMYMSSLEANEHATATVRTEFEAQIQSKDAKIQELLEQLSLIKQSEQEALKRAESSEQEKEKLQKTLEKQEEQYHAQIIDLQSILEDKEHFNKILEDSCASEKQKNQMLQQQIETLEQEQKECMGIKAEAAALHTKIEQLSQNKESLEQELYKIRISSQKQAEEYKQKQKEALEQQKKQMQLDIDRTMLDAERSQQEKIQKLKEQHQTEIEKYQQKYFALLEKLQQSHT